MPPPLRRGPIPGCRGAGHIPLGTGPHPSQVGNSRHTRLGGGVEVGLISACAELGAPEGELAPSAVPGTGSSAGKEPGLRRCPGSGARGAAPRVGL